MMILPMLLAAAVFLLTALYLLSLWRRKKKYQFLPPGPAPLLLLANLAKFIGKQSISERIPELRRKYGPVFTIWKSTDPVVVLCGYEVVKDALLDHGEEFSGRPFSPVIDAYSEGYSFPSIDGERWRQLRRFTISSLRNIGMGKTSMEGQILEESKLLTSAVTLTGGDPFNGVDLLGCAVGNITSYALLGEHFDYKDPKLQELIVTTRNFIGGTNSALHEFGNLFPFVLNIPIFKDKIFKEANDLISFVKKYIEQHKKSLNPTAPRDFTDYFLIRMKEEENFSDSHFTENSLINSLISILGAGIETTTTTLNFSLLLMSHYPDVQAKVQQEIDEVTGSQRPPGIMDRAQLPYTNAVIHEVQRVLDLAPMAHYHAVTKTIQFRGFTIPKGTTVIPFISSVLSDPTQWETPEHFNPGHFLDDKGQFRQKAAFMAFSAGKRICAGENLARMELFLLFSALLQKFTFTLPPGTERQDCRKLKENKIKTLFFSQVCAQPRPVSSTA